MISFLPAVATRRQCVAQTLLAAHAAAAKPFIAFNLPHKTQRTSHSARAGMGHTPQQQLQQASHILDEVYCPWVPNWKPQPFERAASRYLWTDAFGVCAYLSLFHATKDNRLLQQALALVEDVHNTLGHERPKPPSSSTSSSSSGSSSTSWLPGADAEHPTRAGLRIGKSHPEGHSDGDGQYFHYLTKWAFALHEVAAATGEPKYLRWAIELMQTAHRAFVYQTSSGTHRMVWKMSIDLSHPAVSSMGNLDPYDGLVTCTLLQQAARSSSLQQQQSAGGFTQDGAGLDQGQGSRQGARGRQEAGDVLEEEVASFQAMVDARYSSYSSEDPLDLGEALWLSHWQLGQQQQQQGPLQQQQGAAWARHISQVSLSSLEGLWAEGYFEQPLQRRLGFREFGTSIGLQALLAVRPGLPGADVWRQRVQQVHDTWAHKLFTRDRDITPVMYATSLVPGVWLQVP